MRLFFVMICLSCFSAIASISETRQLQLDSFVTNLDRNVLVHLDSLHERLDLFGHTDEERVFMFFGVFGIHYKYDYERKGDRKAKEYTAYYTASKRSGVCRDFAALFKELCDRSSIPCIMAFGRVKRPVNEGVKDLLSLRIRKMNHAWNIVKFNDEWHLMDPTWSTILLVKKYYTYDENGKKRYAGKVKIPIRKYYDASPNFFYQERNAIHPSFYITNEVKEYYRVRSKEKRREVIDTAYNFSEILDSLSSNKYYCFTPDFINAASSYSGHHMIPAQLRDYFGFTDLKRTKFNPLTVKQCDEHLVELGFILSKIQRDFGQNWTSEFEKHKLLIDKNKKKLERSGNFVSK